MESHSPLSQYVITEAQTVSLGELSKGLLSAMTQARTPLNTVQDRSPQEYPPSSPGESRLLVRMTREDMTEFIGTHMGLMWLYDMVMEHPEENKLDREKCLEICSLLEDYVFLMGKKIGNMKSILLEESPKQNRKRTKTESMPGVKFT